MLGKKVGQKLVYLICKISALELIKTEQLLPFATDFVLLYSL